jgi:hypothetical protein
VTISGNKATFKANGTGIDHFKVTIKDMQGSTWTRTYGIAIFQGASSAQ